MLHFFYDIIAKQIKLNSAPPPHLALHNSCSRCSISRVKKIKSSISGIRERSVSLMKFLAKDPPTHVNEPLLLLLIILFSDWAENNRAELNLARKEVENKVNCIK